MDDDFKIFVDRLKGGKVDKLNLSLPPDFLDVTESHLSFKTDVSVKGEAYIAEDALVLHMDIGTREEIPCSICNSPVGVDIHLKGVYHIEPLADIKAGVFDPKEVIRENILLESPSFAECNQGNCPERTRIKKYLKDSASNQSEIRAGRISSFF